MRGVRRNTAAAWPCRDHPLETVLKIVCSWRAEGVPCALARVVATGGSPPLEVGTAMAVSASGALVGGVSRGCVDAAVHSLWLEVTEEDRPTFAVFGSDGDELLAVGPPCGGHLEVFVEPITSATSHPLDRAVRDRRPARAITVLEGWHAGGGRCGAAGTATVMATTTVTTTRCRSRPTGLSPPRRSGADTAVVDAAIGAQLV